MFLCASTPLHSLSHLLVLQEAHLEDCKAAHVREIQLKDKIIKSTKEDASKWQAMYMSANKVDIEQFRAFQNMLKSSPEKPAASSSVE